MDGRQGLDWHGPSAADAFATVTALYDILRTGFVDWVYPRDTKLIVMGHSNGGQGAWYVASRWPDKVKAGMFDRLYLEAFIKLTVKIVVAAAGYIKSQAYVPWTMSRYKEISSLCHSIWADQPFGRFSHFIDPALRAVLETSLLPDDNDLFLSNLAHTPVLAIHGCVW
jgi:pimeloyl-ACP methyl ester carboxylesterase